MKYKMEREMKKIYGREYGISRKEKKRNKKEKIIILNR